MYAIGSKPMRRRLRGLPDKRGGGFTCRRGRARVVPNEKAREASTI